MATLNIGGQRVKVDDAFLSMTPEQQQATVEEIAGRIGGSQPSGPSPAFADAMSDASAMSQSLKGNVADLPSQRPSFADEALSAGRGVIEGVPVLGPMLSDARRGLDANIMSMLHGGEAGQYQDQFKAQDEALRAKTGGARLAGNIGGAVASLAPLGATAMGGKLLGMTGSLPSRLMFGGLSGATLSGADTAARGGNAGEVLTSTALGAGLGTLLPGIGAGVHKVGQGMAQRAATNAAIKGAPDASDLKSVASGMFQQLDQSGVQVSGQRLGQMATDLVQKFVKLRANPSLDPKAVGALQEVVTAINEALKAGTGLALSDLHTLRQIAQKAAQSSEGRDQMFATQIINALDDTIQTLKPGDMVGGADPSQAAKLMFDAIGTWGRSRRVGLIEEAIYKAQNQASGFENGLRAQFRSLLRDPSTRKLFTEAERQEIERVVRGTTGANILKLIGKFGFGGGNASNMLGGSIGSAFGAAVGSPLGPLGSAAGAAVAGGGATLARKASEAVTTKAAERAAKVVATPNVPSLPRLALPDARLAPALLPLMVTN